MDDREFYEQLNQVSAAVAWEGSEPLPSREELDLFRLALSELAGELSTVSDRERLAAVEAVSSQVSRLAALASTDQ